MRRSVVLHARLTHWTAIFNEFCDKVMAQHRNSINIPIRLGDHPALQQCINDKSYRVMIFCAGDISGVQNVAFPHQAELKVNTDEIKANLRGLKNKPGSTRPVDITHTLRLKPHYVNNVEFTYALTNKVRDTSFYTSAQLSIYGALKLKSIGQKFYLVANLCKVTTVAELVTIISTRRRIPKESVVAERKFATLTIACVDGVNVCKQ